MSLNGGAVMGVSLMSVPHGRASSTGVPLIDLYLIGLYLLQTFFSYRRASLTSVYLLGVHLAGMRLIGTSWKPFRFRF